MTSVGAPGRLVIVGGDPLTLAAAAMLAKSLAGHISRLTVVEPAAQAQPAMLVTSPMSRGFYQYLGITPATLSDCGMTPRLTTGYRRWVSDDQDLLLDFDRLGVMLDGVDFHHYLSRLQTAGQPVDIECFSQAAALVRQSSSLTLGAIPAPLNFGLLINTENHEQLLRQVCEQHQVEFVIGDVVNAVRDGSSGSLTSIELADGRQIDGDYFFDLSGARGQLIAKALGSEWVDWSDWLPIDQMVCYAMERTDELPANASLTPFVAGWRMAAVVGDEVRVAQYQHGADEYSERAPAAEARQLSTHPLRPGHRRHLQVANCTALGAAAGFPGDLLIDTLHLLQSAVLRWLDLMPYADGDAKLATEYQRATQREYERVLDVQCLHLSQMQNGHWLESPFWGGVQQIDWPQSLRYRRELFAKTGKLAFYEGDSLAAHSWIALLLALNVWPARYDVLADTVDMTTMQRQLASMQHASR